MIVVTAKGIEKQLKMLLNCVSAPLSILDVETCSIKLKGTQPDLVLLSGQKLSHIECEQGIFILRNTDTLPASIFCSKAVAVLNSANHAAVKLAASRRIWAMTCGLSSVDTFTLSSLMTDSAVISLQRSLTAFDGTRIEPFDLPVRLLRKMDPFVLLACTAVCCMLGNHNPLAGAACWEITRSEIQKNSSSG